MTLVYGAAIAAGLGVLIASVLTSWAPTTRSTMAAAGAWGFGLGGMAASFAGWPGWLAAGCALVAAGGLAWWAAQSAH